MKWLFFMTMIISLPSFAMVTAGTEDCPVQFEGRVKEIIEPVGSGDFFAASSVVFENRHTLKGNVPDKVFLDILQNGPFKVEVDKEYRVLTRNGRLCSMEEI